MEKSNEFIIYFILDNVCNMLSSKIVFQHVWSIKTCGGSFSPRYSNLLNWKMERNVDQKFNGLRPVLLKMLIVFATVALEWN